jgi:hypothetical protein
MTNERKQNGITAEDRGYRRGYDAGLKTGRQNGRTETVREIVEAIAAIPEGVDLEDFYLAVKTEGTEDLESALWALLGKEKGEGE